MKDVDDLDALLKELADDARNAIRHEKLAEDYRQRVRKNLPLARRAGAGPAELERTIDSLFVTRTISRWTADAAAEGTEESQAKPRRKRPGAAPGAS